MLLWRPQALLGSAPFCQLLGQLRGAAPALTDGLPTLHALAQLADELQLAERRNGSALRTGDQHGDAEVRRAGRSALPCRFSLMAHARCGGLMWV